MAGMMELPNEIPWEEEGFPSFDYLFKEIKLWSIQAKFHFCVVWRDCLWAHWICHMNGCPWYVKTSQDPVTGVTNIYLMDWEHNCIIKTGPVMRSVASQQSWIQETVVQYMRVNKDTSSWQIMKCIQLNFHKTINYKVAQHCHIDLIKSDLDAHHYAF